MAFQRINRFFLWVSWLYEFRVTLLIQAVVSFWRACLYFERCIYWKETKKINVEVVDSVIIPALWTGSSLYALWVLIIAAVARKETLRWVTGTTRKLGISFYFMGKSLAVVGVVRFMVLLGDHVATPEIADINLTACFLCGILHIGSVLKLCHIGEDLGFSDGILSVTLSMYSHFTRDISFRILGIFICAAAVFLTNLMFSKCCRLCDVAGDLAVETQEGGDDNQGDETAQTAQSIGAADGEQHDIDIDSDGESVSNFYSPSSGRSWYHDVLPPVI